MFTRVNNLIVFTRAIAHEKVNHPISTGVWNVCVKASAQAAKKEEEYQSLKLQYEELQQKNNGGSFAAQEHRVGGKRPAEADPHVELNCPDIWSHFIADVTKTGYGVI